MTDAARVTETFETIRTTAREFEPDRYVAALLAPPEARNDLIALAAFVAETTKIARQVGEPHMGEIRLQWWRDALSQGAGGAASGNPAADAFASVIRRHDLPMDRVEAYLDALAHSLYAEPPADEAALQREQHLKEGVPFALAARMLGASATGQDAMIALASEVYGLMRLALFLPYSLARGHSPLPSGTAGELTSRETSRAAVATLAAGCRMQLAQFRSRFSAAPRTLRTALLPLALVEPYLRALEKPTHDPAHDIAGISPLTRVVRLGLAHWRGRL